MMHLYLRGEAAQPTAAALELARETRVWLVRSFAPTELPGYQRAEFAGLGGRPRWILPAMTRSSPCLQSLLRRAGA